MTKHTSKKSRHAFEALHGFANASSQIFYLFVIVCCVFVFGGFLRFILSVNQFSETSAPKADAIVVLTGDHARIESGLHLLSKGNGKRLLISGVYPHTSNRAISSRFPDHSELFKCCVDFDRLAENTMQNSVETAKWMKANRFKSVIVVTSDYHLPRSLLEMTHAMPDIKLVPYAAKPENNRLVAGANDLGRLKILAREYFKTLGVSIRPVLN